MWSDIRERLGRGECVFGTMARFSRDPGISNVIANTGFDFMLIDMEHSVYSFETVADIVRVARGVNLATVVRPPARDRFNLSRILDCGATGLMVPMTETREHAIEIRNACNYRPIGKRGVATQVGQTDFAPLKPATEQFGKSNQTSLIIAQVESGPGVENIEDIVSTEGIHGVIIGPNDLADSLGVPGRITDPAVTGSIQTVVDACKKHGKHSGIHTGNLEQLKYWKERGMQLLAYQTDLNALHQIYADYMNALKSL